MDDGSDILDGGAGADTVLVPVWSYVDADTGETITDFVDARISLNAGTFALSTGTSQDQLISIENVETSGGDDAVNGSSRANVISVGDGANLVYAGGGDDTVIGGQFLTYDEQMREVLNSGAGNDLILGKGGVALDWDEEAQAYEYISAGDVLAGGAGDDTIEAGPGSDQRLSGGAGSDTFTFTDATFLYGYAPDLNGDDEATPAQVTITDFDPDEDHIRIRFDKEPGELTFVGETPTSPDSLDRGEMGYRVVASPVSDEQIGVISIAVQDQVSTSPNYLEIWLQGYTGPFSDLDVGLA